MFYREIVETDDLLLFAVAASMPTDASVTPRRCALLLVAILCILSMIVVSFLSDLRLDTVRSSPGSYDTSWLAESATEAPPERTQERRFFDEKDAGPNPGYYMQHLHWFVQVRDHIFCCI